MATSANGILRTDHLGNSSSGNARFDVTFVTDGGDIIRGRTRPNSQFTSTMPLDGRACATWQETAGGTVTFTDITKVKAEPTKPEAAKRLALAEDWTPEDCLTARRIAREQGYADSCYLLTSSDLPGMYLLPLRKDQPTKVVVKTPEFGFIVCEILED